MVKMSISNHIAAPICAFITAFAVMNGEVLFAVLDAAATCFIIYYSINDYQHNMKMSYLDGQTDLLTNMVKNYKNQPTEVTNANT